MGTSGVPSGVGPSVRRLGQLVVVLLAAALIQLGVLQSTHQPITIQDQAARVDTVPAG